MTSRSSAGYSPVPVRIDVDLPLVDDAGGRHAAVKLADIQVASVQRVLRILPDRIDPRDPADRRQPGILPGMDLIIDRLPRRQDRALQLSEMSVCCFPWCFFLFSMSRSVKCRICF